VAFEPFALFSNRSESLGSRVRYQATQGEVYGEVGYRYSLVDGQSNHDISEGFLHIKGHLGELVLGRQHLFLGPSNNNDIGTLLSLDTADAAVYRFPTRGGYNQQVGYLFDTDATRRGGFAGGFARGQAPAWRGYLGYSLLASADKGANVGWSFDTAQSIVKNVIDIYAEAGSDTRARNLYSVGIYVPALYQAYNLDMFLEFAHREGKQDRVSLRLRREIIENLLALAFIDHDRGGVITGGGGLMWSKKF
jgi:hypothetical protein